ANSGDIGRAAAVERDRRACSTPASPDPVSPRHPKHSPYGCFLPDLTRFEAPRRAGPNPRRCMTRTRPRGPTLEQEFNPAVADCGFRAPLAPRLAQPLANVLAPPIRVNSNRNYEPARWMETSSWFAFTRSPAFTSTCSTVPAAGDRS